MSKGGLYGNKKRKEKYDFYTAKEPMGKQENQTAERKSQNMPEKSETQIVIEAESILLWHKEDIKYFKEILP